ncbi:Hypothetical protein SCF082_LOCUS27983 [Durusdinium trenchii]|uniref:Uncharacterized protein n=1 Tax=Durusdinium trenchii TaxID=1381693 RepID=A0ABP0MH52_9DINO
MVHWAGHAARWARCRNAHLSQFARQVNLGLQGHRGLSSCPPLTRICAELMPVQGFVEQRAKTPGTLSRILSGESLESLDGAVSQQVIADFLEMVIASSLGNSRCSLAEIFDIGMSCGSLHCWTRVTAAGERARNFGVVFFTPKLTTWLAVLCTTGAC